MQGEGFGVPGPPTMEGTMMILLVRIYLVVFLGSFCFYFGNQEPGSEWLQLQIKAHRAAGKRSAISAAICAFLANKEQRRSALLPPCFLLPLLSSQKKNLPLPKLLQAPSSSEKPLIFIHT